MGRDRGQCETDQVGCMCRGKVNVKGLRLGVWAEVGSM